MLAYTLAAKLLPQFLWLRVAVVRFYDCAICEYQQNEAEGQAARAEQPHSPLFQCRVVTACAENNTCRAGNVSDFIRIFALSVVERTALFRYTVASVLYDRTKCRAAFGHPDIYERQNQQIVELPKSGKI